MIGYLPRVCHRRIQLCHDGCSTGHEAVDIISIIIIRTACWAIWIIHRALIRICVCVTLEHLVLQIEQVPFLKNRDLIVSPSVSVMLRLKRKQTSDVMPGACSTYLTCKRKINHSYIPGNYNNPVPAQNRKCFASDHGYLVMGKNTLCKNDMCNWRPHGLRLTCYPDYTCRFMPKHIVPNSFTFLFKWPTILNFCKTDPSGLNAKMVVILPNKPNFNILPTKCISRRTWQELAQNWIGVRFMLLCWEILVCLHARFSCGFTVGRKRSTTLMIFRSVTKYSDHQIWSFQAFTHICPRAKLAIHVPETSQTGMHGVHVETFLKSAFIVVMKKGDVNNSVEINLFGKTFHSTILFILPGPGFG